MSAPVLCPDIPVGDCERCAALREVLAGVLAEVPHSHLARFDGGPDDESGSERWCRRCRTNLMLGLPKDDRPPCVTRHAITEPCNCGGDQ